MGNSHWTSLPEVLNQTASEFIDTEEYPDVYRIQDINNGYCREFARKAARRYEGAGTLKLLSYGFKENRPVAHTWLRCNDTHHDAQRMDGVATPMKLPIFQQAEEQHFDPDEIIIEETY